MFETKSKVVERSIGLRNSIIAAKIFGHSREYHFQLHNRNTLKENIKLTRAKLKKINTYILLQGLQVCFRSFMTLGISFYNFDCLK